MINVTIVTKTILGDFYMKSLKLVLTAVVLVSVLAFGAYAATITVTDGNLKAAFAKLDLNEDNTIILKSDVNYTLPSDPHSGHLTIKGDENSATQYKYIFPTGKDIQIYGPTTFENLVLSADAARAIYATGFPLVIGEKVTTSHDHAVYGGKYAGTIKGDTNIEIYGGNYSNIYGGGHSGCVVTGDTHVTVGGNVNSGNSISDSASNFKDTRVYGGGNNAPVSGSTYITYKDNAIFAYVFGAGKSANGTIGVSTNVNIQGGQVMNVYGGSEGAALTNCNTNVRMTGGTVEAIFGASHTSNLTGNANTYLLGGKITRRVYSGCYNETFSSTYKVNGNTTLVISNDVNLSSLSEKVYAGSRNANSSGDDILVYVNNSYDNKKSKVSSSYADYTVTAGTGGTIVSANEAGKIKVVPDFDKYGDIGGTKYINEVATLSSGTTTVTFATNYALTTVTAAQVANGVELSVAGTLNAAGKDLGEKIVASVYDETGRCLGCKILSSAASAVFECETPAGKTYTVKYNVIAGFARAFAPMAPAKTATVIFN